MKRFIMLVMLFGVIELGYCEMVKTTGSLYRSNYTMTPEIKLFNLLTNKIVELENRIQVLENTTIKVSTYSTQGIIISSSIYLNSNTLFIAPVKEEK